MEVYRLLTSIVTSRLFSEIVVMFFSISKKWPLSLVFLIRGVVKIFLRCWATGENMDFVKATIGQPGGFKRLL